MKQKLFYIFIFMVGVFSYANSEIVYTYEQLQQEHDQEELWGVLTSVDVHNCDPAKIRSAEDIREFVVQLCDLIEMKRFGECQIVHFGEDEKVAGYSMMQLIETSLISGHFANKTNIAYIDVFSCKIYDPTVVAEFTRDFFGADDVIVNVTLRR